MDNFFMDRVGSHKAWSQIFLKKKKRKKKSFFEKKATKLVEIFVQVSPSQVGQKFQPYRASFQIDWAVDPQYFYFTVFS